TVLGITDARCNCATVVKSFPLAIQRPWLRPTERLKGLKQANANTGYHAQATAYDSGAVGVAGNIDGRECRCRGSAAFTVCASASGLYTSAVHLDRVLCWRQHWGSLAQR